MFRRLSVTCSLNSPSLKPVCNKLIRCSRRSSTWDYICINAFQERSLGTFIWRWPAGSGSGPGTVTHDVYQRALSRGSEEGGRLPPSGVRCQRSTIYATLSVVGSRDHGASFWLVYSNLCVRCMAERADHMKAWSHNNMFYTCCHGNHLALFHVRQTCIYFVSLHSFFFVLILSLK